ncbi:hypothetical protein BDB01DRAFT_716689, partial [Pilobolus umbonatus]
VTTRPVLFAACVAHHLINVVLIMNMKENYTVKEISMCDRAIPPTVAPIKALGKFYHPGHIKCYHCYDPIDDKTGWKEYQGRVYCRSDFKSLFLPKCRACLKPVEKEAVSAMDGKLKGKWHLECFGCHTCHRPFPDNTFYVYEDSPYCKRHYHQLNNSLCRTCDEPIEGPCAQTIEGWRFHPACFGCSVSIHRFIYHLLFILTHLYRSVIVLLPIFIICLRGAFIVRLIYDNYNANAIFELKRERHNSVKFKQKWIRKRLFMYINFSNPSTSYFLFFIN